MNCDHKHTLVQGDRLFCKDCRSFIRPEMLAENDEDLMALVNLVNSVFDPGMVVVPVRVTFGVKEPPLAPVYRFPEKVVIPDGASPATGADILTKVLREAEEHAARVLPFLDPPDLTPAG